MREHLALQGFARYVLHVRSLKRGFMGNYELLFACVARDTAVVRQYERIIAVPDLEIARQVANAMVGELVDDDQTLDSVMRVVPTERAASVARTPDGYYAMWGRVFRCLNIDIRSVRLWYGSEIGLGTNPTGHVIPRVAQCGEPEIVGFFPWPALPKGGA